MTRSVIDYVLLENLNLSLKRVKNVYFAGCLMFGRLDWIGLSGSTCCWFYVEFRKVCYAYTEGV